MKYTKLLFIIVLLLAIGNKTNATTWVRTNDGNKPIHLDIESIIKKGDWSYYNVKYYEPKVGEDIIVTVQGSPTQAGIVHICRSSKVEQNPSLCSTKDLEDNATKLSELNEESLLYEANVKVFKILNQEKPPFNIREAEEDYIPTPIKEASIEKYVKETVEETMEEPVVENEEDLNDYVFRVQSLIQQNWRPPRSSVSKQIITMFKLSRDGKLISSEVTQTSGSERADDSALAAIKRSAPFEPFPSSYKSNEMEIKFTFKYNVHRRGHEDEDF